MYSAARPTTRPPRMARSPRRGPLALLQGATPASAAICWRFRRPSSGISASSVAAVTRPTPGTVRSRASCAFPEGGLLQAGQDGLLQGGALLLEQAEHLAQGAHHRRAQTLA